ncbi:hypothetical protein H4R18_001667 [Coemansia javaensis]|uniref:Uncharacterized protein n=1 Tax=Coemansia javaensis TaxID=2761396 RepID=A0A9W8LL28_9FUNG|nr:hypothetical protein H4R18_001667 [Coemansia javaensis]
MADGYTINCTLGDSEDLTELSVVGTAEEVGKVTSLVVAVEAEDDPTQGLQGAVAELSDKASVWGAVKELKLAVTLASGSVLEPDSYQDSLGPVAADLKSLLSAPLAFVQDDRSACPVVAQMYQDLAAHFASDGASADHVAEQDEAGDVDDDEEEEEDEQEEDEQGGDQGEAPAGQDDEAEAAAAAPKEEAEEADEDEEAAVDDDDEAANAEDDGEEEVVEAAAGKKRPLDDVEEDEDEDEEADEDADSGAPSKRARLD